MPLQNRVDPFGRLVATPALGAMMGNRGGRIHGRDGALGARRFAGRAWICCELRFRERRRAVWGAGYTELFFLDEATALAAGHRPCFECRRADAMAYRAAAFGRPCPAPEMDRALHAERLGPRPALSAQDVALLPDGAMIACGDDAFLVTAGRLMRWSFAGYSPPTTRLPSADCVLLTPPTSVTALRRGYAPRLHPTACAPLSRDRDAPT